jgi:chromosomal replication initiation ATPase DnaA
VAGEFCVEAKEIVKSRRGRGSENIPRWVAQYLCRELSQATLKVIVGEFGITHISGVNRAVDKLKLILDKNARIKASLKVLYQQLTLRLLRLSIYEENKVIANPKSKTELSSWGATVQ